MKELFQQHIDEKLKYLRQLMVAKNVDSLIIDSGMPLYYFQDDQTMPYRSNPLFLQFCPDRGPGHVLQIRENGKPQLFYFSPDDFWHEVSTFDNPFWADFFDVKVVNDENKIWDMLDTGSGTHRCVTPQPEVAIQNDLELVDDSFLSALNWSRISKTEYEIYCLKEANKIASQGHRAAKEAFLKGMSEKEITQQYLMASSQFETDMPYQSIIALDNFTAILHYQNRRDIKNGKTFLIDAGATYNSYCSDITRTYATDKAHPLFKDLIARVEESQQKLCQMIKPGNDYQKVQEQTHISVAQILIDSKILLDTSVEEAVENDITSTFFPHGVGHALGLQVHDVGGKQLNEQGEKSPDNEKHPFLRTLREIQVNDVLTVEPGIYFIPLLLKDLKADSGKASKVNWRLVEELLPMGGIRIEDDVVARKEGPENLTRPFLP